MFSALKQVRYILVDVDVNQHLHDLLALSAVVTGA